MPTSRSQADRGGFKILWRKPHVSSNLTVGRIKFFYVGLSEWSKEPGLGPGMFALRGTGGANPAADKLGGHGVIGKHNTTSSVRCRFDPYCPPPII